MKSFTSEEIHDMRVRLKYAANERAQIHIFADEMMCSKQDICRALGLDAKAVATKKRYPKALQDAAVSAVIDRHMNFREAGAKFGVSPTTISKWVSEERFAKRTELV